MMDANGKDNASASIPSPEHDSAKTAVTETVVSPMETNLEETVVVSETEDKVEQIMEEVKTEENGIVLVRTDENATEEENIIANEKEEDEMNVENAEEGKNEENSQEEEENNDKEAMEEEKAEENAIEERNEKAEASSKEVKKSRKRSRNKVARSDSKTVAAKDKDKPESSGKKTPSKKAKTVAAKDQDKPESSGKKKPSKETKMVSAKDKEEPESLGKKKRSKEAKTVAAKDKDEPESSGKKKPSKKAEGMGMIFMCSSKTKKDCYRYKVLGLPASKKDIVQKIYKGMRLFLYDVDLKLMYGIYKAAGPGGFNIEPKAFNSAFPSQVRFTVLEECVPLGEEKFKKVIKNNYYSRNKFDCQLNSEQVKNLCKLFASASKGPKSKKAGRSVRAETHTSAGRGRIRRRVSDESRPRSPGRARRYIDRPAVYEREAFVSPMAPMPHVPLPARVPVPPPSYAYGRTVEMDAYRRDPPPEHRGRQYRDEIGSRDQYVYREREPYRDPVYSAGVPPEYNYVPPAEYNYVPPAALPSRYRYADPVSEYRSSAGVPAEYHTPAGLRTEYRSSARNRVYRL